MTAGFGKTVQLVFEPVEADGPREGALDALSRPRFEEANGRIAAAFGFDLTVGLDISF